MKRNHIHFLPFVFLLMVCACSVTVGGQGDYVQTQTVPTPTFTLQLPLKIWISPEVPAPFQKRFILPENMAWAENPAVASIVVATDSSSLEVSSTDQNEKLNTDEPDSNSSVLPMATPDTPLNEEPGIYQERVREIDGAIEVLIPAGEFFFGCDPQHNGGFECLPDELPLQTLYLETFAIDKFEVTNVQYAHCVAAGACEEPVYTYSATRESYYDNPAYADYPISAISWNEAYAYCTWVGGRLPTEAEWEKAARGETMRAYPWGDEEPNCELANSRDDRMGACVGDTAQVGSYPLGASPYGVMDMAGNVWEWVMDYYVHDYSGHLINLDPLTEGVVYKRIIKGGSFDYNSYTMRIAYNSDHTENERNISFGFRCMRPME